MSFSREFDTSVFCHMFMHCLGLYLLQDMFLIAEHLLSRGLQGAKYEIYCEHVAKLALVSSVLRQDHDFDPPCGFHQLPAFLI